MGFRDIQIISAYNHTIFFLIWGQYGKTEIRIGGLRRIATLHAKGYMDREDAELYGVFDVMRPAAEKFAREYGIPKIYESYDELLADSQIVGVELLVPHHLHCEMTIRACEAKKHVSVQKPMALTLVECDRMIAAACKNGVILKVFENFVCYPPYVLAKKMIDEGEIGEPLGMRYKMNDGGLLSRNISDAKERAERIGVKAGKDLPETGWEIDKKSLGWRMTMRSPGEARSCSTTDTTNFLLYSICWVRWKKSARG